MLRWHGRLLSERMQCTVLILLLKPWSNSPSTMVTWVVDTEETFSRRISTSQVSPPECIKCIKVRQSPVSPACTAHPQTTSPHKSLCQSQPLNTKALSTGMRSRCPKKADLLPSPPMNWSSSQCEPRRIPKITRQSESTHYTHSDVMTTTPIVVYTSSKTTKTILVIL